MTARQRARAALARDERLAASHTRGVAARFREEKTAILEAHASGADPTAVLDVDAWEETLARIWIHVGENVFASTVETLADIRPIKQALQGQLVALVQRIIREGRPAERIAQFIAESAEGITTTSRRQIHTILREAGPPAQLRDINRALARLYDSSYIEGRAERIALDNVLRASQTFEDAAARQVAASTGREYHKRWISQGDGNVRESHARAQSENADVHIDDLFKVGGTLLRYPRDPAGPLAETANCRCWTEHFVAR